MRENSSANAPEYDPDTWQEILLDHFRDPRGARPLERPTCRRESRNPLCGDRLSLELELADGCIRAVSARTRGCSLSVASASMLAERLAGIEVEAARRLSRAVQAYLTATDDDQETEVELGELEALGGVRRLAARRPCTLLPWQCLDALLDDCAPDPEGSLHRSGD
ncbi:MAG: SUF system NifU family Fe-S cluster assembly protein [Acidobacteriota bacterium]|nr:SUF system NifU family Fe-S cluster assembly protein [Acidobacteriota bacterium]MDQ7086742.1 SUF system NifU family Fe-S cluster assembly protein [Acidobacteriota bacterium]